MRSVSLICVAIALGAIFALAATRAALNRWPAQSGGAVNPISASMGRPIPAMPGWPGWSGWPAQVKALVQKARRLIKRGDLAGARNAAIRGWLLYAAGHYTRVAADGEPPEYTYLFPRGDALRILDWNRQTRLVYAEARGSTFTVVWQAQLKDPGTRAPRHGGGGGQSLNFLRGDQYRIVREWGRRPAPDTPRVFYHYDPTVAQLFFGRIGFGSGTWIFGDPGLGRPSDWQTVMLPWRHPTKREVQRLFHPQSGTEPMYVLGGTWVPGRAGSRLGHIAWRFPTLPPIPGEAPTAARRPRATKSASPGTVAPAGPRQRPGSPR